VKDSGAVINVEDDGTVTVAAVQKESADKAMDYIRRMSELPEVGKTYQATVKKIMEFGAFVEILRAKRGWSTSHSLILSALRNGRPLQGGDTSKSNSCRSIPKGD